ncbi:type II toxin-antitoxin system Phd/YefM family antitoxin [Nocardia brevicatena]|uniref:type II toxin-antitoxin system Phd/YefM family antitoxin n=1 Tax=Nocardia brevicatena TaxID=37327 RepID=UPI0002F5C8AB|nr:type II toxin-antitoxin system Phd/YefM family antitoxin [Nocardia brevicatena]
MSDYDSVPLSDLRDRLGRVVDQVAESGRPVVVTREGKDAVIMLPASILEEGALPPAFLDEQVRNTTIERLDTKLAEHSPEEVAQAEQWLDRFNEGGSAGAA